MRAGRRLHDLPVTPRTPRLVTGGFIDLRSTRLFRRQWHWQGVFVSFVKRHVAGMLPANERLRYIVISCPIGWAHTQNDPWCSVLTSPGTQLGNMYTLQQDIWFDISEKENQIWCDISEKKNKKKNIRENKQKWFKHSCTLEYSKTKSQPFYEGTIWQ